MAEEVQKSPRRKAKKADDKEFHETVRRKAYELYEGRGGEHGKDLEDWFEAERIVNGKKRK